MAAHITIAVPTDIGQIWTLTDDNGETFQSSYGPARIRNTAPGDYTISWSTVTNYDPPSPASEGPVTVIDGQTKVFTSPTYTPTATTGQITVDCTGFEAAGWLLSPDPGGGNAAGSGSTGPFTCPTSSYTITWLDTVVGYDPPVPQGPVPINSGDSFTFGPPVYTVETSAVNITTDDQTAQWQLTGAGTYSGTGDAIGFVVQPPGSYTLTWQDNIFGKTAPAAEGPISVGAGATIDFALGAYADRSTFTVNAAVQDEGGAPGANFGDWTIAEDSGFTFAAAGDSDTNTTPVVPSSGDFYTGRSYTITWAAEPSYSTPAPQAITVTGTYTGNYTTLTTNSIQLTITLDSGSDITPMDHPYLGTVYPRWSIHGTSYGRDAVTGEGDQVLTKLGNPDSTSGSGGVVTILGMPDDEYWVEWGWTEAAWPPVAFDSAQVTEAAAIGVTLLAPSAKGPWCSATETMSGGAISFDGDYQARSPVAKADLVTGHVMTSIPIWWGGHDIQQDWMIGRNGGWVDTSYSTTDMPWPAAGNSYLYSVRPQAAESMGSNETMHLFWQGSGSLRVYSSGPQGTLLAETAVVDANGQDPGLTFSFDFTDMMNPENTGTGTHGRVYVEVISSGGDPITEVELVHESALGKTTGSPDVTKKDYRSVDNTATPNMINWAGRRQADYMTVVRTLEDASNNLYQPLEGTWDTTGNDNDLEFELAGRELTTQLKYHSYTYGDSMQYQIDMANALGTDMWIYEYHAKNDQRLRDQIALIEAPYTGTRGGGLRAGLKVYYEFANEIWNSMFGPTHYSRYWGCKLAGRSADHNSQPFPQPNSYEGNPVKGFGDTPGSQVLTDASGWVSCRRYVGWRAWNLRNILIEEVVDSGPEYTNLNDRYYIVVAGHNNNSYSMQHVFWDFITGSGRQGLVQFETGVDFKDQVDYISCAAYQQYDLADTLDDITDLSTIPRGSDAWYSLCGDQLTKWYNYQTTGTGGSPPIALLDHYQAWEDISTELGIPVIQYEGGEHNYVSNAVAPTNPNKMRFYRDCETHPGFYKVYRRMLDAHRIYGFEEYLHLSHADAWAQDDNTADYFFAIRDLMYGDETLTRKWQAYVDWGFLNQKWW